MKRKRRFAYGMVRTAVTWRVLTFVINISLADGFTNRDSMNTIRCPYCIENGAFKPMTKRGFGEWWVCEKCGHLSLPSKRLFECTCRKCTGMPTSSRARSLRQTVRIRLLLLYRGVRSLVQQWR